MFITYKETKDYVERAAPGATVGLCGNGFRCFIAEAVRAKYPELRGIAVGLDHALKLVKITAVMPNSSLVTLLTGSDGHKLYELAEAFDGLGRYGHQVKREEALELFQ